MKIKRCSNCFQEKPISEFYPNRTGKKGNEFQSYCKPCKRETFRGWKQRKREPAPDERARRRAISEYGLLLFNKFHNPNKGK